MAGKAEKAFIFQVFMTRALRRDSSRSQLALAVAGCWDRLLMVAAVSAVLSPAGALADGSGEPPPTAGAFIEVIGESSEALEEVPGSATVVRREAIRELQPMSGNEVFRGITGINVVDEEGAGLRMNLGFRGLDPDRSRTVLVLEDGVPIALAPYSSPELYYTPFIERMARVEVVKGSGSIQWGPSTIGGVVNYVTPDPPQTRTVEAEVRAGSHQYTLERLQVGDTRGQIGYLVQGLFQHFTGARALDLNRLDLTTRLKLDLTPQSSLRVKLGLYDEHSHATYLGLTTSQFEANPTLSPAIHDLFEIQRLGLAISHQWLGSQVLVQTTAYGNLVSRHWRRQDYDRIDQGADYERVVDGEGVTVDSGAESASEDGSSIYFKQTAGHRNREYRLMGIESRLTRFFPGDRLGGELQAGLRLHHEDSAIRYLVSSDPEATSGEITSDELRTSDAVSGFLLGKLEYLNRYRISPGVRLELINNIRSLFRMTVDPDTGEPTTDGVPMDVSPANTGTDQIVALIPGIGLSYGLTDGMTLFGGIHRGFAPPRNQDAITATGQVLDLKAEESWNYELGSRFYASNRMAGEVTAFMLDFSNQIIPPSESSGAVSDTVAVNAGSTRHLGMELRLKTELLKPQTHAISLPVSLSYTFVHSRFMDGWSEVITGNVLPYAPEQLATLQLGVAHTSGISAQVTGNYVGAQFTDKENTLDPSPDGTRGLIDARALLDASLSYKLFKGRLALQLAAKNVTNEVYIASRRPAGIQPGAPRQVMVSASGQF